MKGLAQRITEWCDERYPMEREQQIAVDYGLELLLENLIKFAGIFLLAGFFGVADEVAVFCCVFCPFRMLAGGIHMRTGTGCFLFMVVLIGFSLFCKEVFQFSFAGRWFLLTVIAVLCWRYAPCDTKRNPIAFEEIKSKKKVFSVMFSVCCMFVTECVGTEEIKVLVVSALLLETLTILPVIDDINENRFQKRREEV